MISTFLAYTGDTTVKTTTNTFIHFEYAKTKSSGSDARVSSSNEHKIKYTIHNSVRGEIIVMLEMGSLFPTRSDSFHDKKR